MSGGSVVGSRLPVIENSVGDDLDDDFRKIKVITGKNDIAPVHPAGLGTKTKALNGTIIEQQYGPSIASDNVDNDQGNNFVNVDLDADKEEEVSTDNTNGNSNSQESTDTGNSIDDENDSKIDKIDQQVIHTVVNGVVGQADNLSVTADDKHGDNQINGNDGVIESTVIHDLNDSAAPDVSRVQSAEASVTEEAGATSSSSIHLQEEVSSAPADHTSSHAPGANGAEETGATLPTDSPPAYEVSEPAFLPHTHVTSSDPPPPTYRESVASEDKPLTFIDFVPLQINEQYQSFGALMTQANSWLAGHAGYRAKFCESVERSIETVESDINMSTHYERSHLYRKFIRTLRLWVSYSPDCVSLPPQRIRYVTVVPSLAEQGGPGANPALISLDRTLLRFNAKLRSHPIQGKVMNVETQETLLAKGKGPSDPESTYHEERERVCQYYTSIRVYYEEGAATYEEIGYVDFVPKLLAISKDFYNFDKYEKIGTLVKRASEWISSQTNKQFLNIQSLDYRGNTPITSRKPDLIDTDATSRCSSSEKSVMGLRYLRVYYSKVFSGTPPPTVVPTLSYKHAMPVKTAEAGYMGADEFETQTENMERTIDWMKKAGVTSSRVLGVESVSVRLYGGNQNGDPEENLTFKSGGGYKYYLLGVRLFLEGEVAEPLPTELLPIPIILPAKQCCVIN